MIGFAMVTVALWAAYLALTANLQISNLILGALLALGVAALGRPVLGQVPVKNLPAAAWALVQYLVFLIVDIIKCGIVVARIVLDPKLPIRPGVVAVRSHMGQWGTALSAHAITITPGEMVVAISEDGVMYTHCLDAVNSGANADEAQAKRKVLLEKIVS
ncbi:MAG: Na+/H+ antiporter subunit E [Anaerolineales bacterium]|nr:Na+/H+ antiporter subunit E [Anaerolineales bacterium]